MAHETFQGARQKPSPFPFWRVSIWVSMSFGYQKGVVAMQCKFFWDPKSAAIEASTQDKIECDVENFIDHFVSPVGNVVPCHTEEPLNVHLAVSGPLNDRLAGNVQCSCGKALATFTGDSEAKSLSFGCVKEE